MLRENQLHIDFAGIAHFGAVGVNLHALFHFVVAGGDQLFLALDLHHAHTAGADFVDIFEKTERGDGNARFRRGVENRGALFHRNGNVVDFQIYHFSTLPPLKIP